MKKHSQILISLIITAAVHSNAQNTWDKMASFDGGERERAVAFAIGNRGYVGTGMDTANQVKKDFWEYDPGTDSWTQKADFPGQPRRDAIGFAIGNKGYIGTGMNNAVAYLGTRQKDFYEYNPVTNAWAQRANYPGNNNTGIYYACGFSTASKGYICCGKKGASNYSAELWEFNQATNTWTQKVSFPGGVRYGAAAFSIGDMGYVGCGADENIYRNDFYQYNTLTNTWTQKTNFAGSERFNPVGFSIGDRGYIALGTDGGYKKDLWEYNPDDDSWWQKADLPASERRSAIAFTINNYGYAGLGKGSSGVKRSLYRYTPAPFGPVAKNDLPSENFFLVLPNQSSSFENISFNHILPVKSTTTVFDVSGREVFNSHDFPCSLSSSEEKNWTAGIYFFDITMEDEKGRVTHYAGKFIVQ